MKIKETTADVKGRVRIYGWVHRLRRQGTIVKSNNKGHNI
jgi:hypothetical protein